MKQDFEVTVSLEVRCDSCGDELECELNSHGDLNVKPCENCLEHQYNQGYDDGVDEESKRSFDEGYESSERDKKESKDATSSES